MSSHAFASACAFIACERGGHVRSAGSKPKHFYKCAAEDRFFLDVAERRCVQNQVHIGMPIKGHVRAKNDLTRSDFRRKVAQAFLGNNNRVDKNLALLVLTGMPFVRAVGIGPHFAGDFAAP